MRVSRPILAAVVLLMAVPAAIAQEPAAPQITVTGEGSASAVPDMAVVTLGITSQDPEAGVAMGQASEVAGAILARLEGLGIAARDRQTSDLSLSPVWTNYDSGNERKITGYEASNQLTIRVRDLSGLGNVLGAVLEDGANRLSGLSFGLQEPGPVMAEARRDAVSDAMERARTMAEAAGVTLGPVMSISEVGGGSFPQPMMEMARASAVPVAAGEAVMSARVNMVFAITQ